MSEVHEAIVKHAPDAIILADTQGVIRLWNESAARIFGHAEHEALGQSLDLIIPDRLRAAHWQGFDKALASGVTKYAGQVLTTRSMHKDGRTLYVDLGFALLRDESGAVTGVLATARDATTSFNTQKALRARIAELEKPK